MQLRLHGEHNVANALAAAALAGQLGMDVADVAAGLSAATARSRWRMEVTRRPDGVTVVNDAYNANPEAVSAALSALAAMARRRPRVRRARPHDRAGRRRRRSCTSRRAGRPRGPAWPG